MIGEIEALLDEGVDIDGPMLARAFARVQQHVLDDGVGALAVLHDLVEIVAQSVRQFGDFSARLIIERHASQGFPQFIDQFGRDPREIVDEIERVLDLVRDAGGQLTERGQLLRLDQAVLRGAQILQRLRQFAGTASTFSNRRAFSIATTDWSAKVCIRSIVDCGNSPGVLRRTTSAPTICSGRSRGIIRMPR